MEPASQEETATTEDLDRAAGELESQVEKTTDPEQEIPEKPAVDQENAERSQLGRKFVRLEDQMRDIQTSIQALSAQRAEQKQPVPQREFEIATTPEEFEAQTMRVLDKQRDQNSKYSQEYFGAVGRIGANEDPDLYAEIVAEFSNTNSKFHKQYSQNAYNDAEFNYMKIKNNILQTHLKTFKSSGGKKNPLQGNAPSGALGVGGTEKSTTRSTPNVKLDAAAQDFVDSQRARGAEITDAQVQASLAKM